MLSPELAKASSHPVRVKLMAALVTAVSSPSELAAEIDEPLNIVCYHIDSLIKLGCIEVAGTAPTLNDRNTQTFYRAALRPYMSIEAWEGLSDIEKHKWALTTMGLISQDIERAMVNGTFLDPDDNHLSRTPMLVDAEGWEETTEILNQAVEDLLEVQRRSALRLSDKTHGALSQRVEIVHFRSSGSGMSDGPSKGGGG